MHSVYFTTPTRVIHAIREKAPVGIHFISCKLSQKFKYIFPQENDEKRHTHQLIAWIILKNYHIRITNS